ncbi:MAG: DUF5011 domain-containing protein [Cellulosilyticaceae bacterium]
MCPPDPDAYTEKNQPVSGTLTIVVNNGDTSITYILLISPSFGNVTITPNNTSYTWTYTPNLDFVGSDSFIVQAKGSPSGFACPVEITVFVESCAPPVINASNHYLLVGESFNPMTGVTAFDCANNNITTDIIITQNTVDTTMVGTYQVTYQVTDTQGQVTQKTITVVVSQTDPRAQAITDIIESVALEQAALSHILNAEGEKIQKFVALNLSADELLAVNHSVKNMVHSLSLLEIVLQGKLQTFDCSQCGTLS